MPSLHEYGQGVIGTSNIWGRDISTCWYACEYPERPPDPFVMWHSEAPCRGCRIAAEALLRRHPDDTHVQWLNRRLAEVPGDPQPEKG